MTYKVGFPSLKSVDWTELELLSICRRELDERLGPTVAGCRPALLRDLTDRGVPQHIATSIIDFALIKYVTR